MMDEVMTLSLMERQVMDALRDHAHPLGLGELAVHADRTANERVQVVRAAVVGLLERGLVRWDESGIAAVAS